MVIGSRFQQKSISLELVILHKKIASLLIVLLIALASPSTVQSQGGFHLPVGKKKNKISFELVNNLMIVPIEVNGTKLSFLLDTGVSNTILFSLSKKDSLTVKNPEWIKVRGLGTGEPIDALKSSGNTVKIGDTFDVSHEIYFIFEETLDFSKRMGVEINGIIGYDFFKNFIVKINYDTLVLTVNDPEFYTYRRCGNCESFNLFFFKQKPYMDISINRDGTKETNRLLIDSGSSDAIWLFDKKNYLTEAPPNYFEDFLGLGLSGAIYGKRSKLDEISFGDFSIEDPTVSFPDENAIEEIDFYKERDGTLGAGILKKFTVIFDYGNRKMLLKKNVHFNTPYYYNMSGITLEHDGVTMVKDIKSSGRQSTEISDSRGSSIVTTIISPSYYFFMAPRYVIAEIRPNSPGDIAGLIKGDEILRINGKVSQKYELGELIKLFSSRPGKKITFDVERKGRIFRRKITLEKVL